MILFSEPSLLNDLGGALILLGLVGVVSLFFFPRGRHILERSVGLLFTLVVVGGFALTVRAEKLRHADRDLTPAQQAALSEAVRQFPTVKFEVLTSSGDREAHALARKIVDAVKAGSGAMPPFNEAMASPPMGVVLILGPKDVEPDQKAVDSIGTLLMAARVAVIGNRTPELAEHTLRIVVGGKP